MKMSTRRHAHLCVDVRGFTLVELIVAVVILAVVVVPLLHAFVTGAQTEMKSRRYQSATAAAQNIIETIQSTDIDTLLTDPAAYCPNQYSTSSPVFVKPKYDAHDVSKLVEYVADSSSPSVTLTKTGGVSKLTYTPRIVMLDGLQAGSGDSAFKALVRLAQNDSVVQTEVAVSNPAAATIDMTSADAAALAALNLVCSETSFDITAMKNAFSRETSITSHLVGGTYSITVTFTYTGAVTYFYTYDTGNVDDNGNAILQTASRTVTFSRSGNDVGDNRKPIIETANATVPAPSDSEAEALARKGHPAYSLYVRLNPWYPPKTEYNPVNAVENTRIYNYGPTELAPDNKLDFNVFIIDASGTAASAVSAFYQPTIVYKYQNDTNFSRVFTNTLLRKANKNTYSAVSSEKTVGLAIGQSLVEERQVDRMYSVSVRIYKADDDPITAQPIVEMKASKLR
ncbi:MAG: prepilin-type N-terminal cleavage/methylation domain-containing protein [Oscillospiraceae bacterium]|jgi:prepilin-type N-terminal cleavage/methylation domain-containing protein